MDLNLLVKQSQTLSPQMVQSMKILQMGSQELLEYITEAVQENPVLEASESGEVPEELMVLGFDNISVSTTCYPSITTISQPRFQLGFHAFETIYQETHSQSPKKTRMLLPTELLIRQSTSPLTASIKESFA